MMTRVRCERRRARHPHMSKLDTLESAWRKSLDPVQRSLFLIQDQAILQKAIDELDRRHFRWSPSVHNFLEFGYPLVYELESSGQSLNPADYRIHESLIPPQRPFTYSAFPSMNGQVGEPFDSDVDWEVGGEFYDPFGEYEYRLIVRGETDMKKSSNDPRLKGKGPMVAYWWRTALPSGRTPAASGG